MRMQKVPLSKIDYEYRDYSHELYDSILRIGFSFPISVTLYDDKYVCIDGHKRLSALKDILQDNPDYHRGSLVCIVLKEDMRSNDCWRRINIH
ncbi:MAG: ParB N-terminal domain-containing protein [Erysipelotrichaceae bacterium]|nr:ParB N-terminal domain-containing protein [Erysipelotrichaceae bacterium]